MTGTIIVSLHAGINDMRTCQSFFARAESKLNTLMSLWGKLFVVVVTLFIAVPAVLLVLWVIGTAGCYTCDLTIDPTLSWIGVNLGIAKPDGLVHPPTPFNHLQWFLVEAAYIPIVMAAMALAFGAAVKTGHLYWEQANKLTKNAEAKRVAIVVKGANGLITAALGMVVAVPAFGIAIIVLSAAAAILLVLYGLGIGVLPLAIPFWIASAFAGALATRDIKKWALLVGTSMSVVGLTLGTIGAIGILV